MTVIRPRGCARRFVDQVQFGKGFGFVALSAHDHDLKAGIARRLRGPDPDYSPGRGRCRQARGVNPT